MRYTFFIALALILPLASFVGCSEANPHGTVHVEGTITFDGNPVQGVNITLRPRDGAHSAGGITDASGRFTVATGGFNGAKPGEYDITFSKIEIPGGDLSYDEFMAQFGGRQPPAVHLIPQRFGDPNTSGIDPITVTTDRRQNVFRFELTSE